jgi:hypothetical protein
VEGDLTLATAGADQAAVYEWEVGDTRADLVRQIAGEVLVLQDQWTLRIADARTPGSGPGSPGRYTLFEYAQDCDFDQQPLFDLGGIGELNWTEEMLSVGYNAVGREVYLNVVPEPSTVVLLLMGAVGLLAYAWRKRR